MRTGGIVDMSQKPRLQERYEKEIVPALKERLGLKNVMNVPRLEKISLNMGIGTAHEEPALLDQAISHMGRITGQKPVITTAKTAVSAFKIRQGFNVGCKVTLRKAKMYEFLDRLITIAIPRIKDFRGLDSKAFDGRGNFAFGIQEQLIFPEIVPDSVAKPQGMHIVITTTAKTDDRGRALLEAFGVPFKKNAG